LGASNPTSTRINWSFSGDLDSVDITNNVSFAGENIPLLTAKTSGTVVVTATSDADVAKSASCTLRITKPGEKVPEPGTPGIRKNVKTGTATGTATWIAAVLMLGALLALVIYSFRKDRPV
ncbi:MAG: hypothetical protein PHN26_01800, partial [Eubacteriaceae bacterium]|nr:hypothetical protein [Eubacteriaceae bacterium]